MKISKQARREAKQLFRAAQVQGVLDEGRVRQAVDEVIRLKPRGYVAVLSHLQRLIKLETERRAVRIESFSTLEPEAEARLKANLERLHGDRLNYTFTQNPALLGGVRIQVGSDVYDASIRSRLDSLKDSF